MDAAIEAACLDRAVAAAATRELAAWGGGTALHWASLTLPSPQPTLCLALGPWVSDPSSSGEPFQRHGYGAAPGMMRLNLAGSIRGYWRMADPGTAIRIVGFRRGLPVAHGWAPRLRSAGGRRYAESLLVSDGKRWIDADTGRTSQLDEDDASVESALANLVVVPSMSRNPVRWIRPNEP